MYLLSEGSLFYSPVYENIRWSEDDTLYEFNNLSYEFDWSCLSNKLCLNSLYVGSSKIKTLQVISEN